MYSSTNDAMALMFLIQAIDRKSVDALTCTLQVTLLGETFFVLQDIHYIIALYYAKSQNFSTGEAAIRQLFYNINQQGFEAVQDSVKEGEKTDSSTSERW